MLKNIKYILAVASAALMLGSCQDFLNTPPVDSLPGDGYYTTPAHVEQGVRGAYSLLIDIELHHYISFSEDRSDNVWVSPQANGIRICCESSYWRNSIVTSTELEDLWSGWYEIIHNVNTVLAGLDGVDYGNNSALKDQHRGELLFLRGYAHFELARAFGNVPIVSTVLSNSDAKALKQSSAADVINTRAIVDLKDAEKLLPYEDGMQDTNGNKITGQGRADKIVAKAMLARVYMTLKGFPFNDGTAAATAKTYLDEVLKYSADNGDKYWAPTIDEWKKQWMTDPRISNKYQIFAIQHTVSNGNKVSANSGMSVSGQYFPDGGSISGATNGGEMSPIYPEVRLWKEYEDNDDPRGEGLAYMNGYGQWNDTPPYGAMTTEFTYDGETFEAQENAINTKWIPYKEKREALGIAFNDASLGSNPMGWPLNFPIIRLEDMMLLRAELYAEEGDVTNALALVNEIRNRAGIPERSTADADEALEFVKMERKLELYMEGVRWFDEVRYGDWEDLTMEKYDLYKTNGEYRPGTDYANVKGYGQTRYLLPIPNDELQAAPGLYEQNQDW